MSTNQRQGVYTAAMNVLAEADINFDDGQDIRLIMTKELKAQVVSVVTQNLISGEIDMAAESRVKYHDEKTMSKYVSGLVKNWFDKDLRLNGDTKHVVKNPGSRAGAGDDQLKALKTLRTAKEGDAEAVVAIDQAIAERKAELATKKAPEMTEDMLACLPTALRAKLKIGV